MIVERPYVTGGSAKQITSGGPVAVANLLASRFEDSRLFSFPRRWCPAITARGFSDSIVSSTAAGLSICRNCIVQTHYATYLSFSTW